MIYVPLAPYPCTSSCAPNFPYYRLVKSFYFFKGGTTDCEGRNEAQEFREICRGLKILNFSDAEVWEVFQMLAAILHLSNVKLQADSVGVF